MLKSEGTVQALGEIVRLLRRSGVALADAQREAYGIAKYDVATVKRGRKGKRLHLVRSALKIEDGAWTRCGRAAKRTIAWHDGNELAPADPNVMTALCKTCRRSIPRLGGYPDVEQLQAIQCYTLGLPRFRCKLGKHSGDPCRYCRSVIASLFNNGQELRL